MEDFVFKMQWDVMEESKLGVFMSWLLANTF